MGDPAVEAAGGPGAPEPAPGRAAAVVPAPRSGAGSAPAPPPGASDGLAPGAGSQAAAGRPERPERAERVRVVVAGERAARRDPAAREIEEQTEVGEVLVRGLIRTQFALAVRLSLVVALLFGLQPLLFAFAPGLARAEVAGLRLPWLLLGVLAYPLVIAVAWVYVRAAQRNEQDFADLVNRQ